MASLQYLLNRRHHLIADSSLSPRLYTYRQLADVSASIDTLLDPDDLQKLQQQYFGSDVSIVLTNTFDANRFKLKLLGMAQQTAQINQRAAALTRLAVRGYERHVAVAGNIGPVGKSVPHADAVNCYAEQAEALAQGGVDCFWLEAFATRELAEAAIIGCEIGAPHLPIIVTLSYVDGERLPLGIIPISATRSLCERSNVLGVGVDTGAGELNLVHTAQRIAQGCPDAALVVKMDLNAISAESTTTADISTSKSIETYVHVALDAIAAGVRIIAAGRDATPAHLQAISTAINAPKSARSAQNKSNISRKI